MDMKHWSFLRLIAYSIVILLLTTAIHEAGHVVAFNLSGFTVKDVYIGYPATPQVSFPVHGVAVHLTPALPWGRTDPDNAKIPRYIAPWAEPVILMGGILANLLAALILLSLSGTSLREAITFRGKKVTFATFLLASNFVYGIGQAIPGIGGDGSDMLKLLESIQFASN